MNLTRSKQEDSPLDSKIETHNLKDAYIIPAEEGDKIIQTLGEFPIKYSPLLNPILNSLHHAFRGEITVNVAPGKKPLGKVPGNKMPSLYSDK